VFLEIGFITDPLKVLTVVGSGKVGGKRLWWAVAIYFGSIDFENRGISA
jgi:hypothetical protein